MLSTCAVVAVYSAGYVITAPAVGLAQNIPVQVGGLKTEGLRDGTYLGQGQSQFGDVFVTVAIANGRISQVWINAVTTTFPSQTIAGLPGQVVARQSSRVDAVSGATGSSNAFMQAIEAALRRAQP